MSVVVPRALRNGKFATNHSRGSNNYERKTNFDYLTIDQVLKAKQSFWRITERSTFIILIAKDILKRRPSVRK